MLNKKIIFMAILLVSLLSLSAVSAAEDATSDIVADTNDETVLEESIDDTGLADSQNEELEEGDDGGLTPPPIPPSFNLLSDQIVNGGDEVNLTQDYVYQTYSDAHFEKGINITRNVTVNGNGHTIDGGNQARIFNVLPEYSVTFKDIVFINAKAIGDEEYGGAICGNNEGCSAINCTFINNTATYGGAFVRGNATNCTFINNTAEEYAGAFGAGNATNCTFINNTAKWGGAIVETYAYNCTFTQNTATNGGAAGECYAYNCTFTQNTATNGGAIYYGNAINCTFTQNTAMEGGAIANATVINSTFTQNIASQYGGAISNGNATNCNFIKNIALFSGGAIYQGVANNCNFTQNSVDFETDSEFDIDYYSGGAINNGEATNCNFNGNSAMVGGAISKGAATNCTFTQNTAKRYGGAAYEASATNCTFTQNTADWGGAMCGRDATNCTFTQNTAKYGGAILSGNAIDSTFNKNSADWGGAILGAHAYNCKFTENSANYGGAMNTGNATNCTFILNYATVASNDLMAGSTENCKFIVPEFTASDFKTAYNSGEKFIFSLDADGQVLDGVKTIISIYKNGAFVANYTTLSGEGWTVKLTPGTYQAVLSIPNSNVEPVTKTITVTKAPTAITASAVTATYNVNKYLVITLTDSNGKALSGVKVTVTLGSAKTYTTDKNGQIKINVAKLVPKTYTAKIAYAGNANYAAASKSVKVVVKKATPKMTAKAKSFKVKVATKKYTITLKDNKNKVMKNTKVTLTVNKKTFKATTNSKGIATFKITNLKKKGKFTATIKYAGNKYYNKLSKKAKITAK